MEVVEAVRSGRAPVTVCGAGYVGLSLAAVYLRHGMRVILVDINEAKINLIKNKKYVIIEDEVREAVYRGVDTGALSLTTNCTEAVSRSKVVVVTVPIYLDWNTKKIIYKSFRDALVNIGRGLGRDTLVIIESSVPPGTTEEVAAPTLEEASGLKAEKDFLLAYSPERIYIGRAVKDIEENYPKIVAGIGPRSTEAAAKFYEGIARRGVVKLARPRDAEFEKLAEGVYRDVNIALANELALAAMMLGVDFYSAREAANTQPYSHIHLPGPGVGGYCIPIYPYFLANKLLEKGFIANLILTARRINEAMPYEVVKIVEAAASKHGIDRRGDKVALLGVAYRGEIDDTRLSPSREVAALLRAKGFHNIVAHDPYVRKDEVLELLNIEITQDIREALKDARLVVVLTRHKVYKELDVEYIDSLSGRNPLIVDTVNIVKGGGSSERLIVLGKPLPMGLW